MYILYLRGPFALPLFFLSSRGSIAALFNLRAHYFRISSEETSKQGVDVCNRFGEGVPTSALEVTEFFFEKDCGDYRSTHEWMDLNLRHLSRQWICFILCIHNMPADKPAFKTSECKSSFANSQQQV
ncbi:uncharacterized protein EV422DRAFT_526637 [Fimicolochytrium jonesii]|uniref:uncharacterized protein n=1 Tax=Fimicolochytrium jonesii TaxID=1396493 RepID=UPI0022FEA8C8|nr:uncharacterized protein EV422DRAFT_526637 [Fimicolochytrium jonesii]KAI8821713.1 hypothetical protein EV422DRAFT_526637 [Fimicolochytrium jonesii]